MRILLASNNPKKRDELARVLDDAGVTVTTPAAEGLDLEPEEDGATFAANARHKALAFSARTALAVLADDSGLCVDALDGAPGVRSARYAGPGAGDAANRARLLAALQGVEAGRRSARFTCALCLARDGRVLFETEASCPGRILGEERGAGGFGYDPLFFHEPSGCSFAELDAKAKDAVSHRGLALRRLQAYLSPSRT